jgi:hypothetical protein
MLERGVALEWYESVAIVAGLCAEVARRQGAAVPAPQHVFLTEDGTIAVPDRSSGDSKPEALPKLLSRLLGLSAPPPRLRLFVVHATSPNAVTSVEAFASELAFYERPDRLEILKAAYQRYVDTPEGGPQVIPEAEWPDDGPPPPLPTRRRQWPWIAAGGAVVVAALPAAMWLGMLHRPQLVDSAIQSSGIAAVAEKVGTVTRNVTSAVAARLGIGDRPAAARAPGDPASSQPRAALSRTSGQARATVAVNPVPVAAEIVTASEAPADTAAGSGDTLTTADPPPDTETYSRATHEVQPPTLREPRRPPAIVRVADESIANAMELLITEDGSVERVTFLTPPTRLPDMMLLSAAKSWRFDPALKDGRPVRYRMTYNWVTPLR